MAARFVGFYPSLKIGICWPAINLTNDARSSLENAFEP
jgi:hypothetical protein